jgi:micrococcal nuclease
MALIGAVIAVAFWARQSSPPATQQEPAPREAGGLPRVLTGLVVQVVDGDGIDVQLDGQRVRVRYIGVKTPEPQDPCGPEASVANHQLVVGKTARLELDVQPREQGVPWTPRLLAYVHVGRVMVNAELVRLGYAQVATDPPNVRYQDQLLALQWDARATGAGCWGKAW